MGNVEIRTRLERQKQQIAEKRTRAVFDAIAGKDATRLRREIRELGEEPCA